MENTTDNQNFQSLPEIKGTGEVIEIKSTSPGTSSEYLGTPLDVCTDVLKLQSLVEFLFQRLDDIDTLRDVCKSDNVSFRRLAELQASRRGEVINSDGYKLFIK